MKISQAIQRLIALREMHGDIDVYADCPACGNSFGVGLVVAAPETARLRGAVGPPPTDASGEHTRVPKSSSSS